MNKLSVLCMLVLVTLAMGNIEDDVKDCADQLGDLASCIPYVSGTAKMPTPECCEDTQKLKAAKPKCLCVLIKESTDPSLGLPINTTLALQMPAACKIDAKVSDCPSLLKIPADSPDAKIFKITDSASTTTSSSPASSSETKSTTSDTKSTTPTSTSGVAKQISTNIILTMALTVIALIIFI
ncbi:non-specific lipid transfer protein GPI-anchored 14-like [Solanum stenotomum]|uniref:non-specific lipid transfer protein GPI-anchored 14-like n=1 Tax=Solanum stenotomum TaxID=172797 RepID=UPI0020D1869A|nr:non-specific lipid transfer protein GPI-anchored 14-like [Solanum stenotomum]